MKTILTLLLIISVINSIAQNEDRKLMKQNKVKSVTDNAVHGIKNYSEFDRNGLLIKEIKEPYLFISNEAKKIITYKYKDSLIILKIDCVIKRDSIIQSDTTFYEYDSLGRILSEYSPKSKTCIGYFDEFIYGPTYDNNNNKLSKVKRYCADTTFGNLNCDALKKNGINYYLEWYKIYRYNIINTNLYSIYAFTRFYSDEDTHSSKFYNSSIENIIPYGDSIIEKVKIVTEKIDTTNEKKYNCDNSPYWITGPSIECIVIEKYKDFKLMESTSNDLGDFANRMTENKYYDKKGLLIKNVIDFTQIRSGDLFLIPKKETGIEEYSYEYYK